MNVAGTCYIDADPARVWAGLMNPELLARCIPGCSRWRRPVTASTP